MWPLGFLLNVTPFAILLAVAWFMAPQFARARSAILQRLGIEQMRYMRLLRISSLVLIGCLIAALVGAGVVRPLIAPPASNFVVLVAVIIAVVVGQLVVRALDGFGPTRGVHSTLAMVNKAARKGSF